MYMSDGQDLDSTIEELEKAARDAELELLPLADALDKEAERLQPPVGIWAVAWSRSNLGAQAVMYYEDNGFRRPPPGKEWDSEWGFLHRQDDGWREVDHDEVVKLIEQSAGVTLDELAAQTKVLRDRVLHHHQILVTASDRIPGETAQRVGFDQRREQVEKLDANTLSARGFGNSRLTGKFMTRDPISMKGGLRLAPHENAEVVGLAASAIAERARELVRAAARAAATADGIRHLPSRPAAADPPGNSDVAGVRSKLDGLAVVISAIALIVLFAVIAAGAAVVRDRADEHIEPSTGRFTLWPLLSAGVGGIGVLAVILALAVMWHGLARRRPDHVQIVLGKPLAWGAGLGLGGALLIIYGIG